MWTGGQLPELDERVLPGMKRHGSFGYGWSEFLCGIL